jgi:hypothetical protein
MEGTPDRLGASLIVKQVSRCFVARGEAWRWKSRAGIAQRFAMQVYGLCLGAMLTE